MVSFHSYVSLPKGKKGDRFTIGWWLIFILGFTTLAPVDVWESLQVSDSIMKQLRRPARIQWRPEQAHTPTGFASPLLLGKL